MTKIKNFNIAKLHTEEDFGFQQRVAQEAQQLVTTTGANEVGVADAVVSPNQQMVDDYTAALNAFDSALKESSDNPYTAILAAIDEKSDAAWSGLNAQIKTMLNFPADEGRAIAAEANAIMKKYGNITGMAYNEEYGNMRNLMQDFATMGKEKYKKIYVDAWLEEMENQYMAFMEADAARNAEDAKRNYGIVKQTRTGADAAYRTLVERTNAYALVYGEAGYADFISKVNVMIDQANSTLAARATRAANKKKPVV